MHISWSGIWRCGHVSFKRKRNEARRKAQNNFDAEVARISEAYARERKEEAKKNAIKRARAAKKQQSSRNSCGKAAKY